MKSRDEHGRDGMAGRLRLLDTGGSDDSRPKYERLRSLLAAEVTAGRIRPGEALPSEKHLAELFRVARTTVRQALAGLERDGLVRRRHGAGTFITDLADRGLPVGLDVFALVVPGAGTGFWPALQSGFEAAASEMQKQILFCDTGNNLDKQASAIMQLVQKRVAGVALAPTSIPTTPKYQVAHLQEHGIPVVFCHRGVEGIDAPLLAIPFHDVGRKAGEFLLARGHRRVAFFSMHQRNEAGAGYEAGLREVLAAAGHELPEQHVYWGTPQSPDVSCQSEAVAAALATMLTSDDPPTAIMASFDPLAELIYLLLGQMGVRVPQDVSLIGVGGTWRHGAITSQLTSVTIDEEDLGRRAARILWEINSGARLLLDQERILVPLGLAAGRTVGPPPAPRAVAGLSTRQSSPPTE